MPQRKPKSLLPAGAPDPPPNVSRPGTLYVGPAGWSYPDWSGYVYPARRPKGFHEATYLAEFFDTIEINTSFYQPFRPDHAAQWIDRVLVNPRFLFTAKLWQRFTHDSIPGPTLADERVVRAGFDVLRAAHKLGAILLQFPFSFHCTKETLSYLSALLKRFADYPLVVEFRHASWDSPETQSLQSVVNALQLISILKSTKVKVPEPLRRHYPELEDLADTPPAEPTLFSLAGSKKEKRNKM